MIWHSPGKVWQSSKIRMMLITRDWFIHGIECWPEMGFIFLPGSIVILLIAGTFLIIHPILFTTGTNGQMFLSMMIILFITKGHIALG